MLTSEFGNFVNAIRKGTEHCPCFHKCCFPYAEHWNNNKFANMLVM